MRDGGRAVGMWGAPGAWENVQARVRMSSDRPSDDRRLTGAPAGERRGPLTVLIVDPDRVAAERTAAPLRASCIVGIAGSAAGAVALIRQRTPDMILTELDLPDMRGIDFI